MVVNNEVKALKEQGKKMEEQIQRMNEEL